MGQEEVDKSLDNIPRNELKFFYDAGKVCLAGWILGLFACFWTPSNLIGIGTGMSLTFGSFLFWKLLKLLYQLGIEVFQMVKKLFSDKKVKLLQEENAELKKQLKAYEPITSGSFRNNDLVEKE